LSHHRQPYSDIVVYGSRDVRRDVVGPLSAPQSLASVDLGWRDFVIFEVLLAIGAFSVIQLALRSLNAIETSAWMIVVVVVAMEERGSLWSLRCSDRRAAIASLVSRCDDNHWALLIDFCGSSKWAHLFVVTVTVWEIREGIVARVPLCYSLADNFLVYHQFLILFDSHVIPCQQLFYDLAVTYHVANDAQSNQPEREREGGRVAIFSER
jgi:hypothetical protein